MEIINTMNRLGTKIYGTAWGDEVYAVITKNKNNMRMSAELYFKTANGSVSELYTVRKQDICSKKNYMDFLLDLEIEITKDEIIAIKNKLLDLMKPNKERVQIQTRATLKEAHVSVSKYIIENQEELKDNPKAEVFLRNGYAYMTSGAWEQFMKENKELGYKKLELLKNFKVQGILIPAKDRPYDCLVSINGKKDWFYRFILHEEVDTENEEMEVITV